MRETKQKKKNIKECSIKDQWTEYFLKAESSMEEEWEAFIYPNIKDFCFDYTLELAPGAGRNTKKLIPFCNEIHLVELNSYALNLCRFRFTDYSGKCAIYYHLNDGQSLSMISDATITAVYTWDSAVHFDRLVIREYLKEFSRVLKPEGKIFLHHSNYGSFSDNTKFKKNPRWRSNMSAKLCKEYCSEFGLKVIKQHIMDWRGSKDLDCISIIQKP